MFFGTPQAFYRTGEGESIISHKSDIWSGCVTMINILVGKEVNEEPDKHVRCIPCDSTKKIPFKFSFC